MKVLNQNIDRIFHCQSLKRLLSIYLTALDNFIELSNNNIFEDLIKKFLKFDLEMRFSSCISNSFYKLDAKIYRTHLKLFLRNKRICNDDKFIINKKLFKNEKFDNVFEIKFLNIKKIINTHFGFFLILEKSEEVLTFIFTDYNLKLNIIEKLQKRCYEYLNKEITFDMSDLKSKINIKIEENSFKQFVKNYKCLKLTIFGDYVKINISINDSYIYEIIDYKIANKICIEKIFKITENHDNTKNIIIHFKNGMKLRYCFNFQDSYCFLSQIKGIINDKKKNILVNENKNLIFSVGDYDINKYFIRGQKTCKYILDSYEKNLLNNIIEPEKLTKKELEEFLDILLINGRFIQYLNFDFRQFLVIFKKQLKNFFSLEKSIKIINQYDIKLFELLINKTSNRNEIVLDHENLQTDKLLMLNQAQNEKIKSFNISYKIWEILTLLIQNEYFFKKVSYDYNSNPRNSNIYIKIFVKATQILTQDFSPSFGFIGGQFLLKFIDNYNPNLKKIETLNKNFLLNEKKEFNLLLEATKYLSPFLKYNEESKKFFNSNIIQIELILDIYLSIIFKKKSSTLKKDLEKTIKILTTPFYFQFLTQISLLKAPEIIFKASLLTNSIIECLETKEKVSIYQKLILDNSTLLLRHIEFCISPVLLKQKQSSILLIYHCLIDNIEAGALITRLIPEPLFKCVIENSYDTSKWSLSMWEELFKNLNLDFNSPTLQWNSKSREELLNIIKKEIKDFYLHLEGLENNVIEEIVYKMMENENFEVGKKLEEDILQLNWNYSVYEVSYESLDFKIPVFKYYLQELIKDQKNPCFVLNNIKGSRIFWEKLINFYFVCDDIDKRIIYLKCLILLYEQYFAQIKDFSFIIIIVKNLRSEKNEKIIYLFLQLIYAFLNVQDKILQIKNYKAFIKSNGISLILEIIQNNFFTDDLNNIDYENLKNNLKKNFEVIFCFIKDKLPREAYSESILKSNIIILCLRIFSNCIERTKSQFKKSLLMIPRPLSKKIAFKKSSILLLQKILLLKDNNLLNETLHFFSLTYMDKFHFKKIIANKWIFPLLIYKFEKKTANSITLFLKSILENLLITENNIIQTLLKNIKTLDIHSSINNLKIYSSNSIESKDEILSIFKIFTGLYYLPPYFWYILQHDSNNFTEVLLNGCSNSFLIWNTKAFLDLKKNLFNILLPLKNNNFSIEFEPYIMRYSFANELTCGPIILKNWIYFKDRKKFLNRDNIEDLVSKLCSYFKNIVEKLINFNFIENELRTILGETHVILEVLSNLFKNSDKIVFKYLNSIKDFMEFYYSIFYEIGNNDLDNSIDLKGENLKNIKLENTDKKDFKKKKMTRRISEEKQIKNFSVEVNKIRKFTVNCITFDNKDSSLIEKLNFKKKGQKSNFLNEDLKIKIRYNNHNLLDYTLQNCFKLLKNVLKPEGNIKNSQLFIKNKELQFVIVKLMQRTVLETKFKTYNYTFNNLKINLLFLNMLFNLYETNGYKLISFIDLNPNCGLYDIEHILANFDLKIIENFINFIKNKYDDESKIDKTLDSESVKPYEDLNELSDIEFENQNFSKDLIIEDIKKVKNMKYIDKNVLEKLGVNQNEEKLDVNIEKEIENSEESYEEDNETDLTGSMLLITNNKKEKDEVLPELFKEKEAFKPKDDNDRYIMIKIEEMKRNSFKFLLKTLDLEAIKRKMGNFDFSRTKINDTFFKNVSQRPRIYFELKNMIHDLLKLWVLIVYKLSKNSQNCKKMIESSLVIKCFSLSFYYQLLKNKSNTLSIQLNLFSQICYKVFYNVLNFSLMATIVNKPIEAELIKNNLKSFKFNKLFNMAEQVENDFELLIYFYSVMKNFLGEKFLLIILKKKNDFIKKLVRDFKEDGFEIKRTELMNLGVLINKQIIENLCIKKYNEFNLLLGEKKVDIK